MEDQKVKVYFVFMIRRLIQSRGMSQRDLALASGLTETTISRYMNGTRLPGIKEVASLCRALDCDPSELIYF